MFKSLAVLTVAGLIYAAMADEKGVATRKSLFDFTVKGIDGKDVALSKYKGNVCLVVNVASY